MIPYLAIPSGTGLIDFKTMAAIESARAAYPTMARRVQVCSLLAYAFNTLYADALNQRKDGVTHFVMVHDDVAPQDKDGVCWLRVMEQEMLIRGVPVLSASVAVRGTLDSSAAVDTTQAATRIPLKELNAKVGIHSRDCALLINTGCLVIDIRHEWAERLSFHVRDGIRKLKDGTFAPFVEPEDWELSRSLRRMGVPFAVTAAIETLHAGTHRWSSR